VDEVTVPRTPPAAVRAQLRREVFNGCPIPGCGSPYLEWHHFDPEFAVAPHHNPDGMIALCAEHHAKAGGGAYTIDQLREFKASPFMKDKVVSGRFEWMRHDLLTVVGGNFYYETPVPVQYQGHPVVAVRRDSNGYFQLSAHMLSQSTDERTHLHDNDWIALGNPEHMLCPPNGRILDVHYVGGDRLRIEFFDVASPTDIESRYPGSQPSRWGINYPMTAVEITMAIGGTSIEFGPRHTTVGGLVMTNCFASHCRAGLVF
jgi:hypothetical protein